MKRLPKQRRTGLFSATMTDAVAELVRAGLRNPVRVVVKVENMIDKSEQRIPETLDIFYSLCPVKHRLFALSEYLANNRDQKTIVYFSTCACVDYYFKLLQGIKSDLNLFHLHGKMEHKKRTLIYSQFTSSKRGILFCTDLAARGLDFNDIDLVIQFDAPQDPATFAHRCGRTARIGRSGMAILFLDSKEESYIDLLNGRKIPVKPIHPLLPIPSSTNFLDSIRQANTLNRELFEKSIRAFVSYIRFYQEHLAKFIFRLRDLDIGALANSFGLLKLPRMPELQDFKVVDFTPTKVDTDLIPYLDKAREKQRKLNLAKAKTNKEKDTRQLKRPAVSQPWSQNKARKQRRLDRKTKKDLLNVRNGQQGVKTLTDGSDNDQEINDEWKLMKQEKRMEARLRQQGL